MKKVNVSFQGPDFNPARNPNSEGAYDRGFNIVVDAYDFDFGCLTVDPNLDNGVNFTLAVPSKYMNEEGVECGQIAWRIEPDWALVSALPELGEQIGKIYGRIIVTAVQA